ncbi:MAG: hypothetical protein KY467_15750 [Gemmatimonadetes bacterium]|nr:hypothetical protein [Gemmatimonadota bacterium]
MNARIQIMLHSRQLEVSPAAEGEVALWRKAVQSLTSSVVPGLDPDARFTLTYQAGLQAAMALVRAAGFRVRGEAHHHHTFAAVAALELGESSDAARDLNVIRRKRHGAIYDWETHLDEEQVDELRAAARRLFTHAQTWLRTTHPGIQPLPPNLS